MSTIKVQPPRKAVVTRQTKVAPGGGFTTRRGRPLPPEYWPKYVTHNRIDLFKVLTLRPDDYLSIADIIALWNAAGFQPITEKALISVIKHLRTMHWIEARKVRDGTRRLGYRLTTRPLYTVKYYVGEEAGDDE